ncbi:hypothetical protein LTR86_003280 [Recurvomyces mirabilis]|nr:hypothetical protein LTR86_003280 [Recurvomyces mirabilis]
MALHSRPVLSGNGYGSFWGPQTSAVNFCEEDYVITHLIAEFFNTVTSLLYIAYGVHGIRRYKRKSASVFANVNLPYWGLVGVGVFSGAYHMTLKYHTQMCMLRSHPSTFNANRLQADELSMHVATGTVMHQLFTFKQPPERKRLVRAGLLGVLVPFYVYHCLADEFTVHVLLFLSMVFTVIWKTRKEIQIHIIRPEDRRKLTKLTTFGSFCAVFAYVLWNIDVNCCPTLTRWKHRVGMPWAVALEFHGWWHVLTAVASYAFMAIIEFLTFPEDLDDKNRSARGIGFAWPATIVMQELGGVANGGEGDAKRR